MKTSKLKDRLSKNRSMTSITIRMPEDVIEDLKRVAPHRGFTGYQPLIRAYVGQGLREDLAALENKPEITKLIASLKKQGIKDTAIERAMAEAGVVGG
jgi:hypothetical protein